MLIRSGYILVTCVTFQGSYSTNLVSPEMLAVVLFVLEKFRGNLKMHIKNHIKSYEIM